MSIRKRIADYIRAGYAGLFITSHEEARIKAEIAAVANDLGYSVYVWTVTSSLMGPLGDPEPKKFTDPSNQAELGPDGLLRYMCGMLPKKSIVLAMDFHLFTGESNPYIIRLCKDCLTTARANMQRLIVLGCQVKLCPELEKEFTVVNFDLPGREELGEVLKEIADSAQVRLNGNTDKIIDSACGMTTMEAADAFALAVVESGGDKIPPEIVAREKSNVVKKNGLLEIVESSETINDVGGNDGLKEWILKRKNAFSKEAKTFGLPIPRGALLVGIPGCGKTQFGRVIANVLNIPLLKLDAGKIFAGLVGQSESNLRSVIQTVEAVAPCVLLVDEIEKGLSGSKSSGQTDGGTSARVFGTFLQWMNDKKSAVFVVATANDISQLPPEFLRKGRFDELFFADLPNADEREQIFKIHISKQKRDASKFNLTWLAEETNEFTGSEIEAVVIDALYIAFDRGTDLNEECLKEAIGATVPLSRTMSAQVTSLREWARNRTRPCSKSKPSKTIPAGRRIEM